jgi:phospholipid/cholesterol/gamma-HCH transport system ATP-binding protein
MKRDLAPILELVAARPVFEASNLPKARFDLRLLAGDCILIEVTDLRRAGALADLCSGLLPLAEGEVRFLGIDWTTVNDARVGALRGRIGRVQQRGAWNGLRGTEIDILLPRLHHTNETAASLSEAALHLARRFGLPGLPVGPPRQIADADLARAACVRAFLGRPDLLLLEDPVNPADAALLPPLLRALTQARDAGAAAICFTRHRALWHDVRSFVTQCLRLDDQGLGRSGHH